MYLDSLRMFCELVETHSFTRTAKQHGVTQSAVSQMLQAVERDARWQLVHRPRATPGRQVFELTPEGEVYHQYAREILRLAGDLDRELARVRVTAGGTIELAVCFSIGLHQLPPLLLRFQQAWPMVEVRVHYGSIDRVHDQVLDNVVDLGLVCYPQRRHGLGIEPFRQERLMLVCHPQHPLAARPAVTMPDLAGHTLVAWNELHRSPFLRGVPRNHRHLFQPAHEFDQVELVKRAVEAETGVAILPETVVRAEVAHKILAAVPFEKGGHTEPLGIICREKKLLSPAMNCLLHALRPPPPMG